MLLFENHYFAHSNAGSIVSKVSFSSYYKMIFVVGNQMQQMLFFDFCLNFHYAKLQFILLICNICICNRIKKKHEVHPCGSTMKRLKEFIRSVPDYCRTGRGGCSIEYPVHNYLNNIRTAFNNQNLLRINIMINSRLSVFFEILQKFW